MIMICLLLLKPYLNIKNISAISSVPILLYIVLMRSFVGFIFMIVGYLSCKYKLFEKNNVSFVTKYYLCIYKS